MFDDHILPYFPGITAVLDAYHVLERLADTLASIYGAGSATAKRTYNRLCRLVTGRALRAKAAKPRAGTPKRRSPVAPYDKRRRYPSYDADKLVDEGLPVHSGGALIAALKRLDVGTKRKATAVLEKLIEYLEARKDRIAYDDFWHRGFLISSAAMESFHRIAQQRLKLPGTTWTTAMAQAIRNLRIMSVVGNDARFWENATMRERVAHAFNSGGEL